MKSSFGLFPTPFESVKVTSFWDVARAAVGQPQDGELIRQLSKYQDSLFTKYWNSAPSASRSASYDIVELVRHQQCLTIDK